MPLIPVPKYQITIAADKLLVTDITGAYHAVDNPGGWGAPNPEMNESAVFAIIIRKDSEGDQQLTALTNQFVYDPSAVNTKETTFEFAYLNDGVHEITVGQLDVSLDGVNLIAGPATPIVDGKYFYWDSKVWVRLAGVNTEVTDFSDLLDEDANVLQGLCEDIPVAKLAIKKQELYKEWRQKRITECDDAAEKFQELLELREDISGAVYSFYSTLKIEAQDQIETLLEKYELADAA